MRQIAGLILSASLFVSGCAKASQSDSITLGMKASVCGVLTTEKHFGPPNFGENPKTDSTFVAWVIRPDSPVMLTSQKHSRPNQTDRVQLYFDTGKVTENDGKSLLGKHVCASGYSEQPNTPGDIAPANISVDAIRVSGTQRDRPGS
jgi:hypothetical protein